MFYAFLLLRFTICAGDNMRFFCFVQLSKGKFGLWRIMLSSCSRMRLFWIPSWRRMPLSSRTKKEAWERACRKVQVGCEGVHKYEEGQDCREGYEVELGCSQIIVCAFCSAASILCPFFSDCNFCFIWKPLNLDDLFYRVLRHQLVPPCWGSLPLTIFHTVYLMLGRS